MGSRKRCACRCAGACDRACDRAGDRAGDRACDRAGDRVGDRVGERDLLCDSLEWAWSIFIIFSIIMGPNLTDRKEKKCTGYQVVLGRKNEVVTQATDYRDKGRVPHYR